MNLFVNQIQIMLNIELVQPQSFDFGRHLIIICNELVQAFCHTGNLNNDAGQWFDIETV